jgi:hypothetical protein
LCAPTPRTCSSKPDCSSLFAALFPRNWITNFLENDGTLEAAQRIARRSGHGIKRLVKEFETKGSGLNTKVAQKVDQRIYR